MMVEQRKTVFIYTINQVENNKLPHKVPDKAVFFIQKVLGPVVQS